MAYLFGGVSLSSEIHKFSSSSSADDDASADLDLDALVDINNESSSSSEQKVNKRRHRSRSGPMNDMFRLDLSGGASPDSDLYWSKVEQQNATSPPARWQHTANFIESLNGIIVFGGFGLDSSSAECRLNDTWLFDVKSETWSKPQPSHLGRSIESCSPWTSFGKPSKTPPSPRGGHAAALVGGGSCLVVFGGYGGGGPHTRRDLNDVHVFHLPTCQWFSVDTAGSPPLARSGHALLSSVDSRSGRDNLFVLGGWSASQQFDDVHILENDGSTLTWSKVETASGPDSWGPRRWQFGAISVKAVPNWKIFVFGGNSGDLDATRPQGWRQNNLQVLECASPTSPPSSSQGDGRSTTTALSWLHPEVVGGSSPSPRSDTPIIFSKDLGKIFLFGGWSGRWHDDIFTCDVADIVGPPYNIFTVQAVDWTEATSPITGGVQLLISGRGFAASSGGATNAIVKFACPKGAIEVSGDVQGDSEIVCTSPDFLEYGADERVAVTLKIGGASRFTNNSLPFSFFSVTDASQTVAWGPGILNGIGSNTETSFIIQAKDESSKDRVCGMDKFKVVIRELLEEKAENESPQQHNYSQLKENNAIGIIAATKLKARAARIRRRLSETLVPHELEDCIDGTYVVKFIPPQNGYYRVDVDFQGTFQGRSGPIRGSPFTMHAISTDDDSANDLNGSVLHHEIETFIANLKQSSSTITKGLGKSVANDDLRSLLTVKEHLRSLAQSKEQIENGIAANRSALLYLKKHSLPFSSLNTLIKDLEVAVSSWEATKALVPETLDRISDVDQVWREKTRFKVEAYESEVQAKHSEFKKLPFFSYYRTNDDGTVGTKLGEQAAKLVMMDAETQLESEKRNLEENAHLCGIFELEGLVDSSRKHVNEMKHDLKAMSQLWDVADKLEMFIDATKEQVWSSVDLESVEERAKAHLKEVKGLDKCTRWCDAFQSLDQICKDFLATIPLIVLLGSKCMRPRHWQALKDATGAKDFVPPCENENTSMGDLLAIDLLAKSNDVEEICDQAAKEDKMETSLQQINDRWSSIDLIMTPYAKKDGELEEDVPLLGIGEEDFESLENDQLVIQGMMASRYLAQFEQEVNAWQKALFNINEVFLLVGDIQRTWSYLEPLFIHSDEVKRELPEDASRFITIDIDTRKVLHKAWVTKNVKQAFNEEGLMDKLEGIQDQYAIKYH